MLSNNSLFWSVTLGRVRRTSDDPYTKATARFAKSRFGYTLIELMVVVGVLATLLGMLVPMLGSARASARGVKCLFNLQNIGFAASTYWSRYGDCIPNNSYTLGDDPSTLNPPPPAGTPGAATALRRDNTSTSNLEWFDALAPITGWAGKRTVAARYGAGQELAFRNATKYLWCPDFDPTQFDPGVWATSYGICQRLSLAFNRKLTPAASNEGPLDLLEFKSIRARSACVFLGESGFLNYNSDAYNLTNAALGNVTKHNLAPVTAKIKHGGLNYLFLDGHVSRESKPPHSMGGEVGSFSTSDGVSYNISTEDDAAFCARFGSLPGN